MAAAVVQTENAHYRLSKCRGLYLFPLHRLILVRPGTCLAGVAEANGSIPVQAARLFDLQTSITYVASHYSSTLLIPYYLPGPGALAGMWISLGPEKW